MAGKTNGGHSRTEPAFKLALSGQGQAEVQSHIGNVRQQVTDLLANKKTLEGQLDSVKRRGRSLVDTAVSLLVLLGYTPQDAAKEVEQWQQPEESQSPRKV